MKQPTKMHDFVPKESVWFQHTNGELSASIISVGKKDPNAVELKIEGWLGTHFMPYTKIRRGKKQGK